MNWILSFVGARFYDQTKQLALGPEPRHEENGPEGSGGDRRGKRKAESNDPGVATPSCLVDRRWRARSRCFLTVSRFASAGVCRGWYRRKLRELPERSGVYVFVNRQDECFDGTVEIIDVLMTRLFTIDQWLY